MRRALVIAGLALAGVARADLAPPPPDPSEGTWFGSMRQVDVDGERSYPMTLTVNGDRGTTDYPKLKCGGELERVGSASGGYLVYKETITRGAFNMTEGEGCVDGVVTLHADGDQMLLGWFGAFDGRPMLASASLARGQFNSR
jgi:hypothetical protein